MKFQVLHLILVLVLLWITAARSNAGTQYQQIYIFSQSDLASHNQDNVFGFHGEQDGLVLDFNPAISGTKSTTFQVLRVDNPPVTKNHFAVTGRIDTALADKSPPVKARFEVLTDFADGSSQISKLGLDANQQKNEFSIPVTVPENTWPSKVQLNLVTDQVFGMEIHHPSIIESVGDSPTTLPTVSQMLLSDETIVRYFTHADFVEPEQTGGNSFDAWGTWGTPNEQGVVYYSPLFDGITHAAFRIAKGTTAGLFREGLFQQQNNSPSDPCVSKFRLLSADSLTVASAHFTVAGRITGTTDSRGPVDFTNVRLQVTATTRDGQRLTGACGLADYNATAAPSQIFRIPFTNTSNSPITHLDLSVIVPGGALLTFDEVDLIVPGASKFVAGTLPAAVTVPANNRPAVVATPLPLDTEIVNAPSPQGNVGPVQTAVSDDLQSRTFEFLRAPLDQSPRRIELLSQDAPSLRPGTFGITGTTFYEGLQPSTDMDGSAWFELTTDYADGTRTVTGTTAEYGPCGVMTGHSSDRPFAVLATSAVQPVRVRLELLCRGTGRVRISPLSLVQYEPIPVAAAVQSATPPPWWSLPRVTRPAGFGLLGIMVLAAIIFLIPAAEPSTGGWLIFLFALAQASFAWAMFLLGRDMPLFNVMPLLVASLAWLLPLVSKWIASTRVRRQELRKIYSLDVAN